MISTLLSHKNAPQILQLTVRVLTIVLYAVATSLFFGSSEHSVPAPFPHFDKLAHFCVFFALACMTEFSVNARIIYKIMALAIYGALIEVCQGAFFDREMSFWDWYADMAGVICFYFLILKTKLSCLRSWVMAQLRRS